MNTQPRRIRMQWTNSALFALISITLSASAFAADFGNSGSFGNNDVNSARGIDLGYPHLPRTFADVNGDGRADYCRFVGNAPGIFLSCALARANGTFGAYDVNSDPGFDAGNADRERGFADVNGDGRADYCRFVGNAPEIFLSCALATAAGRFGNYDVNSQHFPSPSWIWRDSPRTSHWVDLDGDGFAESCPQLPPALPNDIWYCYIPTLGDYLLGDYLFTLATIDIPPSFDAGDPAFPRMFADVNSDGRGDYCRVVGRAAQKALSCTLMSAGRRLGTLAVKSPPVAAGFHLGLPDYPRMLADVTGDGRVDYCRFVDLAGIRRLSCAVAAASGSFGNHDVLGQQGFNAGLANQPRALADVNADGRADYCRFIADAQGIFLSCALARSPVRPAGLPSFEGPLFTPKMPNATGVRHVVAILWDPHRPDHPAPSVKAIDELLFGANPSVRDWYRENSGGRFRLTREAVLGWYPADRPAEHYWKEGSDDDPHDGWLRGHVEKWAEAVRKADVDFNFSVHDTNRDGTLHPAELAILIVIPQSQPFGTVNDVVGRQVPTSEPLVVDGVRIPRIAEWYTGAPLNLGVPVHELSHLLLGTPDLYMNGKPWPFAARALSIMDAALGTTHFDPFVKLKTGWLSTRVVSNGGTYLLGDVETTREAIILYDPVRGPGEYFLIENRWRGSSYDAGRSGVGGGLPNSGLAIWHIIENPALLQLSTPPIGSPQEWGRRGIRLVRANGGVPEDDAKALFQTPGVTVSSSTSPARLRWVDGSRSGFEVKLRSNPGSSVWISVSRN